MPVERRGRAIAFEIGSTGNGRNPIFNGRRQPSRGGTSRMTRECQVRICERLGVRFLGPTRPQETVGPAARESAYRGGADEKCDIRQRRQISKAREIAIVSDLLAMRRYLAVD